MILRKFAGIFSRPFSSIFVGLGPIKTLMSTGGRALFHVYRWLFVPPATTIVHNNPRLARKRGGLAGSRAGLSGSRGGLSGSRGRLSASTWRILCLETPEVRLATRTVRLATRTVCLATRRSGVARQTRWVARRNTRRRPDASHG